MNREFLKDYKRVLFNLLEYSILPNREQNTLIKYQNTRAKNTP